ncbi:magnesium transporter NIPA-domain-containing protein [Phlebopus sp. FC_14]|nr:magnesium transporter NIPA-domain-containing protein [Phlebopus sp. FC_14]
MVEDKYIGLALAVSSSVAIGTSFIITKKGLTDASARNSAYSNASDDYAYLRNPTWWAGISTRMSTCWNSHFVIDLPVVVVLGEIANFAAYTFAPPILVTPLGALSVLIGAVLASFLLNEELGHLGRTGCALCLIGSVIIVLHAPADKEIETVDEILTYAVQPGFMLYCLTVFVFSIVMIFKIAPRYGRSNPLVYISICSLVGSVSIMAIKGFGVAVKLTLGGNNQFTHPSTYVFGIVVVGCILVQMNFFNKALDTFSTNVVNPIYYVGFSTATIVASLILFQGFNTTDGTNTVTLLAGFIVTFLGVHLLNLSRKPDPDTAPLGHSALEAGLMNPRMSLQGRPSLDGWGGTSQLRPDGVLHSAGHGRRSSLYRAQSNTLFNAFEEEHTPGDMPLTQLRESEEEEEESDNEADERTRLHSQHRSVSRSHSSSPVLQDSARGSPRPS